MRVRPLIYVAGVVLAGFGVLGCGDDDPSPSEPLLRTPGIGDGAAWIPDPSKPPSPEDSTFTALVTRIGCNGGETGTVYSPGIFTSETEVIVTFTVEPSAGGDCPSNDRVPVEVDLGQPLGDRTLLDGSCQPSGSGAGTSHCDQDS